MPVAAKDPVELDEVRLARRHEESELWEPLTAGAESEFRVDLERLRFAPAFARLADVTQVVTADATDGLVHNRLTHSIKVTALARGIAVGLRQIADPADIERWGGLDHVVAQAGAVAHDLGHPPFGHLGERTLDRIARERFGLADGFEGNAQTFRIITELEVHGAHDDGLNLTAAARAAVLKYPWGRFHAPDPHPSQWQDRPRGANPGAHGSGAAKFNAYVPDLAEMLEVLQGFELPPGRQTLECAVMDLADDIAYSLHDLEDFHRSGVLQYSPISGEFRSWLGEQERWLGVPDAELETLVRKPGAGLERLRRAARDKDDWVFDDDIFTEAVKIVGTEFVDGVLVTPFDGSREADRAISGFVSRWIDHFTAAVRMNPDPATARTPVVTVNPLEWHQIQVLKFMHQYFVLHRPDLAMVQRGQSMLLTDLVETFDSWLSDRFDATRAPRRLLDLVALSEQGHQRVREEHPEWLDGRTDRGDVARMARGRAITDFVAGLSDAQAVAYAGRLGPSSGLLWASGV
ncbi:dGTPase [Propionibacteriaceae bacterium ES.041]|uniref:deoxyguanosinetriphosphate triphosphohydrolase family protein n=1 Tax=Enemella evansiae TaxID=2016499 RepID=UPI000B97B8C6|nr:dNTP triphosphohydrolase [Enemella evansiae]OYN96904.1 phosphodiesterase [Enemella evansiae]PFG68994.1 dGTPase [Propionibacteriaceae bacterium ES.041]